MGNKNHLKNTNDQNFAHLMRGLRQKLLRYMCFDLKDAYLLSEDFFKNLGTIKPKKLESKVQYTNRDELDYIISRTRDNLNLELMKYLISNSITISKQGKYFTFLKLCFNNADVCIQLTSLGLATKIQLYNLIISFQKWAPCLKVNFNLFYFIEYMLDKWSWEKITERSNCNCCFCSIDIKGKSKIFCCSFFVLLICFRIWTCWIVSGVKIVINEWLWKQVVATSKYMIHTSNLISGRCIWVSFTTFFNKTIATLHIQSSYYNNGQSGEWNPNTSSRNQVRCMDHILWCSYNLFSKSLIDNYLYSRNYSACSNSEANKQHKEGTAKDFRLTFDVNWAKTAITIGSFCDLLPRPFIEHVFYKVK